MAENTTYSYITKHMVYHNGKKYLRGSKIELSAKDAAPLLAQSSIVPGEGTVVVVTQPVALGNSTLEKLSLVELTDYARAHSIGHAPDATKAIIIEAISAAAVAAA